MNTIGDLVAHATLIATRGPSYYGRRGAVMVWCWYCRQIINIQCSEHARRPEWMPGHDGEPYWRWEQEAEFMARHLAGCPDFALWLASGSELKTKIDWKG